MKDKGIQLVDNGDDGQVLDLKIKPVRDEFGKIVSGLVIGSTLQQNKASILIAKQGEFKHRPDIGVGIGDLTLSSDFLEYRHKVREHFKKDGLKITALDLYPNMPVKIEAAYE